MKHQFEGGHKKSSCDCNCKCGSGKNKNHSCCEENESTDTQVDSLITRQRDLEQELADITEKLRKFKTTSVN